MDGRQYPLASSTHGSTGVQLNTYDEANPQGIRNNLEIFLNFLVTTI